MILNLMSLGGMLLLAWPVLRYDLRLRRASQLEFDTSIKDEAHRAEREAILAVVGGWSNWQSLILWSGYALLFLAQLARTYQSFGDS